MANNTVLARVSGFSHLLVIDEPICMIDAGGASEVRYYYHYDGLGSVIALSNIDGDIVEAYSYDVYGKPTIYTSAGADGIWRTADDTTSTESAIGNPFMFTGRRYDAESGLYYYRARMYSPAIGRFLQPDPISYWDSMNLYQYCLNNPINFKDPHGLILKGLIGTVTAVTGGMIAGIGFATGNPVVVYAGCALYGTGIAIVVWEFYDDDDAVEGMVDKGKKAIEKHCKELEKEVEEIERGGRPPDDDDATGKDSNSLPRGY